MTNRKLFFRLTLLLVVTIFAVFIALPKTKLNLKKLGINFEAIHLDRSISSWSHWLHDVSKHKFCRSFWFQYSKFCYRDDLIPDMVVDFQKIQE